MQLWISRLIETECSKFSVPRQKLAVEVSADVVVFGGKCAVNELFIVFGVALEVPTLSWG